MSWKSQRFIRRRRPLSTQMIPKDQDGGGRMGGPFEWTRAAVMEEGEVSTLLV